MRKCPQTDTQNVLEHGESVWKYMQKIVKKDWDGLIIPKWLFEKYDYIVHNLYDMKTIELYNIYHDCGKPYCIQYVDGKRHFPNHAEVSYHKFLEYFDNQIVADLIRDDMVIHTATAQEILSRKWTKQHFLTLLLSALAEIHANAEMFGGIASTSFKIKYKKISARGNLI